MRDLLRLPLLHLMFVLATLGASVGETAAQEVEAKVTKIHPLPGAIAELGGLAANDSVIVASACSSAGGAGGDAFAGVAAPGPRPLTRKANSLSGNLVHLDREHIEGKSGAPKLLVKSTIPFEGKFGGGTWDGQNFWHVVYSKNVILKLDRTDNRIIGLIPTPSKGVTGGITFDGKDFWVHGTDAHKIFQIDRAEGKVLHSIPSNPSVNGLAWYNDRLYVSINGRGVDPPVPGDPAIQVWDPKTGRVLKSYPLPANLYPHDMAFVKPASLLIMMQEGTDAWSDFHLYKFDIPELKLE